MEPLCCSPGSGPPSTWAALLNDYSQSTLLVHPAHDAAKGLALRVGTPRLLEASRNGSPALDRHGKPIEPRKLADTEVAMVYLAPEAFVPGAASGTAADIYALGWLLFELYAREQTFQAARFRDRVRDINAFIDLHTLRGARCVYCTIIILFVFSYVYQQKQTQTKTQ